MSNVQWEAVEHSALSRMLSSSLDSGIYVEEKVERLYKPEVMDDSNSIFQIHQDWYS